ncbi:signal peptidase I [Frondihabitans sp. PhB188]|uniref:signal peptidase I n=1 Tax=Frondihabitans sp. PhB188 TaxID=2485200 RepID=UPI000F4A7A21|nr:signal peptidase I [Frondihabitans sp. PhB188]ROQ36743.1 signal peptidase I [Frondihabitans sp. PhB188]
MTSAPATASRGFRAAVAIREVILWIGSVIGVLCLLVAAAALLFGVTPLVFRTGSMSPQIPTGALALSKTVPAAELQPGDVVSVIRGDGERVTHRLVSKAERPDGAWSLVIKGDANAEADPDPIVTRSADRVFWSTPGLGFVLSAVSKPQVVFPVGALFGMLAVIGFRPPLDKRLLRDPEELESRDDKLEGAGTRPPPPASPSDATAPSPHPRHLAESDADPALTTASFSDAYDARRHASAAHHAR